MKRIWCCSILVLGLLAMSYAAQEPKKDDKKVEKKGEKKLPLPEIPPTHASVS
jgi:hypothetical protein